MPPQSNPQPVTAANTLPRFNMPLALDLCPGARRHGEPRHRRGDRFTGRLPQTCAGLQVDPAALEGGGGRQCGGGVG